MKMAAALEYTPPVASLIKALKNGRDPALVKTAAAFLFIQWDRMKWPLPDALMAVPTQRIFQFLYGKDHAEKLAQECGLLFDCEVIHPLFRKNGGQPQEGKNSLQRGKMTFEQFYLKKGEGLNKRIFIIDDVVVTGRTLQGVEYALRKGGCKDLYTLCLSYSPLNSK